MPEPPRIGGFKIEVDGRWDVADLQEFSESLLEAYGFLYHVVADEESSLRLRDSKFVIFDDDLDLFPWGRLLYGSIPPEQRIKIKSFQYSSPGVIEIVAVLGALALAARVVRAWVGTGEALLGLLDKITKFLEHRRRARLERSRARDADEGTIALNLVFEFGGSLGFDRNSLATLIEVAGGPIGALKLLVGVARPGKQLAELQQEGKLAFPEENGEHRQLPSSRKRSSGARKRRQRRESDEK
jgi:hypothetical protein